jgi:hypothetical protein
MRALRVIGFIFASGCLQIDCEGFFDVPDLTARQCFNGTYDRGPCDRAYDECRLSYNGDTCTCSQQLQWHCSGPDLAVPVGRD